MSTVAISYNSLKDASGEAKDVAKKLDTYAESLNRNVYKKLCNYEGACTQNIIDARSSLNNKINALNSRAADYRDYASDLDDLRTECDNTDKSVKGMVSKLTGTFKDAHGITNSKVQNTINYFFTSLGNSSSVGRWLGDGKDKWEQKNDYIKQSIEDWWDYEGGKQLVKGMAIAILEVVAGICSVVAAIAAIVSGGWTIALVAALVGGVIATVNGVTNMINEGRAYAATQAGDPATGRRLSDEDTIQDVMRNESEENVSFWYKVANGIDIVNLGCAIVSVVSSCGQLVKNAYKWTTGSMADIKNLRIKDILTMDNIKAFGSKIKLTIGNGWQEIKTAIRLNDFTSVKSFLFDFGDDFVNNLKNSFLNFDSVKDTASSIKELVSIPKALLKDGFNAKNIIFDIGITSVILPNLAMGEIVTYDPENASMAGSIFSYDIDSIRPGNIYDIGDSIINKIIGSDVFSNNSILGNNVLAKLSESCNVDISIPDIYVPDINIPDINIPDINILAI